MTNAPQTDLDPPCTGLHREADDWNDLGRRIRQAAARATAGVLLKSALTSAANGPAFASSARSPRTTTLPEN